MLLGDAAQRYEFYLQSRARLRFDDLSIAIDCANGSTFKVAPDVFSFLGARLVAINSHPTGANINLGCGSQNPELLRSLIKGGTFDVGFAFDGDGDRVIAIDETGAVLDGDHIMNALAIHFKEKGLLSKDVLVATSMSNLGLERSMEKAGIRLIRTDVGDRNVLEEMLRQDSILGGEQSGHVVILTENSTGDGIITALAFLTVMKETGLKASELGAWMKQYPQLLKNVPVKNKKKAASNEAFVQYLGQRSKSAGNDFRIVVRPSGTEPLIRVMVEGPDEHSVSLLVDEISAKIAQIGA
jgi:phosphoglucosamine mutase